MKKKIFVMSMASLLCALPLVSCGGDAPVPSASSNPPSSSDSGLSSEVPPVTTMEEFVSTVDPDAVTRDFDDRFDVEVEDFSGENIAGKTTGTKNKGYLMVNIDNNLPSFPMSKDKPIYKLASGSFEAMHLGQNGLGFKMRVTKGSIKLSDLVLELRGDDAWDDIQIDLGESLNNDEEQNPELTDEFQDILVNAVNTLGEDVAYKMKSTGEEVGTTVGQKVIAFHLRAKENATVSAQIEIEDVFTYVGTTRTVLDDFNRSNLNAPTLNVPGAWWGGAEGGSTILVRKGITLSKDEAYTTPNLSEEASKKNHIVYSLQGDTTNASLTITLSDDSKITKNWSELLADGEKHLVNAVNGAYANYVIDLSAIAGEKTVKTVEIKNGGDKMLSISNVFMTSLEVPTLNKVFPHLNTSESVIVDNFNREINGLDRDYDKSHALQANIDSGIDYTLSYNANGNGQDIVLDGTDVSLPATTDYYNLKTKTSRDCTGYQYLVFAIKGEEGYDLNNFRFKTGELTSELYFNQAYAAEGVKTYGDTETSNPYADVNGYTWYVVDLAYHKAMSPIAKVGQEKASTVDIYYTGSKAIKIGSIFMANAEAVHETAKVSSEVEGIDVDTSGYRHLGAFEKVSSRYFGFEVKGDGQATIGSFRYEFDGKSNWFKDGKVVAYMNGRRVKADEILPTEVTTVWIDFEASDTPMDGTKVDFACGLDGFSGLANVGKLYLAEEQYLEKFDGTDKDVTIPEKSQYAYGFGLDFVKKSDRLYFHLAGDGNNNLAEFRFQFMTTGNVDLATLFPNHEGEEHLYLRKVSDGSEINATDALTVEGIDVYMDFKENGIDKDVLTVIHAHFGGANEVGGNYKFTNFQFGWDEIPYSVAMSSYVE